MGLIAAIFLTGVWVLQLAGIKRDRRGGQRRRGVGRRGREALTPVGPAKQAGRAGLAPVVSPHSTCFRGEEPSGEDDHLTLVRAHPAASHRPVSRSPLFARRRPATLARRPVLLRSIYTQSSRQKFRRRRA